MAAYTPDFGSIRAKVDSIRADVQPTIDRVNRMDVKDVRLRPTTEDSPGHFFEEGELASRNEVPFRPKHETERHKVDFSATAQKVFTHVRGRGHGHGQDI